MKPFCFIRYLVSDAFTSNWQKELFVTYKMSPVQAMCGVNLFSCLFTSVSLLQVRKAFKKKSYLNDCIFSQLCLKSFQQDGFFKSLVFMSQFPKFTFDCIVLSLCSAFGQLFIFHTIDAFGKSERFIKESLKACLRTAQIFSKFSHDIAILYVLSGTTAIFQKFCFWLVQSVFLRMHNL